MRKYNITVNGNQYAVEVEEVKAGAPKTSPILKNINLTTNAKPNNSHANGEKIIAPMPGNIISIAVNVGDTVTSGQVLLVFESMKMQNDLTSHVDGVVAEINTATGSLVAVGDVLVVIE